MTTWGPQTTSLTATMLVYRNCPWMEQRNRDWGSVPERYRPPL